MRKFYDLHVEFEWNDPSQLGYERIFIPFFITNKYDRDQINIMNVEKGKPKHLNSDLFRFRDWRFDIEILSKIRDKNKYVEFSFQDIAKEIKEGHIQRIRLFTQVIRAYKIPYIFTSGAHNIDETRSPKEIALLGEFLGLSQRGVLDSMSKNVENLLEDKGWI